MTPDAPCVACGMPTNVIVNFKLGVYWGNRVGDFSLAICLCCWTQACARALLIWLRGNGVDLRPVRWPPVFGGGIAWWCG